MTRDSSYVVGSVSGERIGEGPGKGGGTDLTGETGNSDTTERLATDSGNGIQVIPVVDRDRVVSTGELPVGEGEGGEGTPGVSQLLVAPR